MLPKNWCKSPIGSKKEVRVRKSKRLLFVSSLSVIIVSGLLMTAVPGFSQAQPAPTIIYQQPPMVIYPGPAYPAPVIVAPAYPASVVLGTAAINAASRIISSAVIGYHRYPRVYYAPVRPYPFRGWRR